MSGKIKFKSRSKLQKINKLSPPAERKLSLVDIPESEELEIHKKASKTQPAKKVRFPKKRINQLQMMPNEFKNTQNAIEAHELEDRQRAVYADSIESFCGYDSLIRILSKFYSRQVAYYRSDKGGALSPEEARAKVYRQNITDEEGLELLNQLMSIPAERINFFHLTELHEHSRTAAQNLWEMMKREAQHEFESGHRAADAYQPADSLADAWNRASYLGLRESLCEEWNPKGGIELTIIDTIAQAFLQLQYWTKESFKRAQQEPRREHFKFAQWKEWAREAKANYWENGHWDIPLVKEKEAIEHAAQMAERWQRMYFRAIRNLRDLRRYSQQVTINNPRQVNIAGEGGQQINVSKKEEEKTKKIPLKKTHNARGRADE